MIELPTGLPKGTPVMVEMAIDRDGIFTVSSYLKDSRESTYIEKSLHFGASKTQSGRNGRTGAKDEHSTNRDNLEFYQAFFAIIADTPAINRYLNPRSGTRAKVAGGNDRADTGRG